MRKKLGQAVQAVGGLLPLLLAGASDMGHIGAGQLAAGVCAAAALLLLGRLLTRWPIPVPRSVADGCAPSGAR